ncbi:hypothetical protein F6X40_11075 [Paraburkholderia sp. UCT31]|uniref:GIY-YIG nuclease family protein n=1 Tax=Paraburkholderia sp. UCT31 TaxID=2615209 RepID=UPI0016555D8A|nr:GIY-YIG nuclease family protein [Paraburkholderia sp. UCT31]MBC8737345.1 hypothetical protein [Paraburkholderia sp. UCT31]
MDTNIDSSTFGYVYILTNPSIPGQVKIGKTTRSPQERLAEISGATGVPTPFDLAYYKAFPDCHVAERMIHQALEESGLRISKAREFFRCSLPEATQFLDDLHKHLTENTPSELVSVELLQKGREYLQGSLVTLKDETRALSLLRRAAELGNPEAMFLAATLIEKRDKQEALQFYIRAADAGELLAYSRGALILWNANQHEDAREAWEIFFEHAGRENVTPEQYEEAAVAYLVSHYRYEEIPSMPPQLKRMRWKLTWLAAKERKLQLASWLFWNLGTILQKFEIVLGLVFLPAVVADLVHKRPFLSLIAPTLFLGSMAVRHLVRLGHAAAQKLSASKATAALKATARAEAKAAEKASKAEAKAAAKAAARAEKDSAQQAKVARKEAKKQAPLDQNKAPTGNTLLNVQNAETSQPDQKGSPLGQKAFAPKNPAPMAERAEPSFGSHLFSINDVDPSVPSPQRATDADEDESEQPDGMATARAIVNAHADQSNPKQPAGQVQDRSNKNPQIKGVFKARKAGARRDARGG